MKTTIEWIPVERELPPQDAGPPAFYLIANLGGFVRQAEWRTATTAGPSQRDGAWIIGSTVLTTVTHWAHLPEHPRSLSKELEDEG